MSGMIPGVGVPHRRRVHHHNQSFRVNSTQTGSFLRDRQNPSTDLSETALKARQRLEKKLGHCCLQLSSRSGDDEQRKDGSFLGSSKLVKISRPWKSQSPNKVNKSERKMNRNESNIKVCSCC